MTKQKKNLLILFFMVITSTAIYYLLSQERIIFFEDEKMNDPQKSPENITIQGRRLLNAPKSLTAEKIKKIVPINPPHESWKKRIEHTLRLQGGDAIKTLDIEKAESFVWLVDGQPLNVESVVVRIQNEKNEETIFRALVDSSNGKILHTWDQPVVDPINPRNKFKVKIDPRYFENGP